jgi:CelD/BcsL family acetyltransferase involved in cellulose biosynthesis
MKQRLTAQRVPIGALREEWSGLAARARTANAFTSWTFLSTWWDHFGARREPRIYEVRRGDGRLVAVIPLYVEERRDRVGTFRVLSNLGYGAVVHPDFLDALVEKGAEEEVAEALRGPLGEDDSWDHAELSDLEPEGSFVRIGRQLADELHWDMTLERRSLCPTIRLPGSFEEYLATQNPHFRQQLRRYRRKIEKDLRVEWKRVGEDVDIGTGMLAITRLHQERMEATARGGNFRKRDYREFHRDLAERMNASGELFFWLLYSEEQPIATHYGLLSGGVYYGYQMGFSPRYQKWSPGHYMTGTVLEMLIERGAHEMNLLRGDDPWKLRWTQEKRHTVTLALVRPGLPSHLSWVRSNLSQPPAIALRFLMGRDSFDEIRAAWKGSRAWLRAPGSPPRGPARSGGKGQPGR